MPNQSNREIVRRRLRLHNDFGGKCWFPECEENDLENLEFAHLFQTELKGRGRGRKERINDISKNPGSYGYFCKFHHAEVERILKILDQGRMDMDFPPIFLSKVDE